MHEFHVGDYARSIETGWKGKILDIESKFVRIDAQSGCWEEMCKMVGVDHLVQMVTGLPDELALTPDDIQFFSVHDLVPVRH